MSILKKIKFDFTTYFIIFGSLLCGYFKNILLILLIIIIHELGHVFFLKKYHAEIEEIRLYPFGGITKTKMLINTKTTHSIIIALGGFIFQIILFLIFHLIFKFHIIRPPIYNLFLKYNTSIILFNLIPIIPLDGSLILKNLFAKFLSFKLSNILTLVLSFLNILIYLSLNYLLAINNYLIVSILIYKSIIFLKRIPYEQNLLYLERYLYKLKFSKIKYINNKKYFKLDTYHYIKNNNHILKEEEYLEKLFDNPVSY